MPCIQNSKGKIMTYIYDWFGIQRDEGLEITCPNCQGHAHFFFAKFIKIRHKKDDVLFQTHPLFDHIIIKNSYGITERNAVYYPNLYGIKPLTDDDMPEHYHCCDLYYHYNNKSGVCVCQNCGIRKKYELNWQKDAYYQTTIKNQVLWAFDKEHLLNIKKFIQSNHRNEKAYRNHHYLFHLPTIFKEHKNRDELVKKIDKLLKDKG